MECVKTGLSVLNREFRECFIEEVIFSQDLNEASEKSVQGRANSKRRGRPGDLYQWE